MAPGYSKSGFTFTLAALLWSGFKVSHLYLCICTHHILDLETWLCGPGPGFEKLESTLIETGTL